LKLQALEQLWTRLRSQPAPAQQRRFERFRREQGQPLCQFGVYCVLAERHGRDWRTWPGEYRRPDGAAVSRLATEQAERVRFHQWLQWLVDEQLARAARELAPMMDLPIGFDPGGVDAWAWQDLLALDTAMGAPPDDFNTLGQDWGLPPFVPHRLQAVGYEPFIQTLRASLHHARGLRIDHVLGLFRLFWVPHGVAPAQGGYVRYPIEDLLAIVALESWRARAIIVGEDLGTVEPGVRERLRRARILGYRLLLFADEPPGRYSRLSLAALTNHDVPTVAGLWSGAELAMQRRLKLHPNEEGMRAMLARLRRAAGVAEDAAIQEVIPRAYRALARARSMLVTATLEDALAVPERPNVPGTVAEWPNWCLALPKPLADIEKEPLVKEVAQALARGRPQKSHR
jgi:4-alpha-glucanotransferase